MANAGYDVYLVAQGETYEKNGVHIVGFGPKRSSRLQRMLFTTRLAYQKALAVDADIYHLHDPELLPYGMKLKHRGKKVIFDSHEKYTEQIRCKGYLPNWCRSLIAACYGAYERFVLKRIDGLVFPSPLRGKNPFEGQCRNFTFLSNVPRMEELYHQYNAHTQKYERSLVHVGVLSYTRGITHLVQAAAQSECTVYLAGAFSPASYQTEVETLPEFSHAEYLGKLDRPAVADLLQKCQIGIATLLNVGQYNQFNCLATKVYEYMSLGLPVILTRSSYNETVVEQYQFGICVDPENIEEISNAIRYLFDHPDEARRMGENGRRAIREEFNWSIEEQKLFSLYKTILTEK